MRKALASTWVLLVIATGCEVQQRGNESAAGNGASYDMSAQPTPPLPAVVQDPSQPAGAVPQQQEQEMVRERAQVGVGEKGRDIGEGIISTPIKAYFSAKQQIVFNIQIPHAMNLYKATNDRAPRTHDEFMSKIIKANFVKLPQLPEGHEYVYDPEKEELMVEHPR